MLWVGGPRYRGGHDCGLTVMTSTCTRLGAAWWYQTGPSNIESVMHRVAAAYDKKISKRQTMAERKSKAEEIFRRLKDLGRRCLLLTQGLREVRFSIRGFGAVIRR